MNFEKLGTLVSIQTGKLDANAASANGRYPFFTCAREPLRISNYKYDLDAILIAGNGDLNVKHYKGKFDAYQRTYILSVVDCSLVATRYLYYFLDSYLDRLRAQSIGGVIKYIKLGMLTDALVPIPEYSEQLRVAAILDQASQLLRKRQQATEKFADLAHAAFRDLFGDPNLNTKGWPIAEVGSVTDCIVPGRDKPKSFSGNIPWITTAELKHLDVTESTDSKLGLTEAEIHEVRARVIPPRSVIMTCVGDLGVVSIANVPMVINQQLHAFQCSEDVEPEYLMHALSYQANYMRRIATQTTLPYMNKSVCNSIAIPLPPVELQKRFSETLRALLKLKRTSKGYGEVLHSLFFSLQCAAFAGELTLRQAERALEMVG